MKICGTMSHEMEVKLLIMLLVFIDAVPAAAGWEGAPAPVPAGWEGAAPGWEGATGAPGNWDPVPQ